MHPVRQAPARRGPRVLRELQRGAPSPAGSARCDPCAKRSYDRSAEHRGIPVWPARYTVIELATGIDHGTFESDTEVAACLAFAKLGPDDVEIVSDASPMARFTAWA